MVTASSIRQRAIADRIARGDRVDEYFSRKNDGQAWTIGRVAIANRDAVLFQAVSIELLLRNAIDARPNSGLPELQDILTKIQELRAMLATTTSELDVGAKALSLKECVLAWLAKDPCAV